MNFINLIIGIILIPSGIFVIDFTAKFTKKHGPGYYSKVGIVGIGMLILAILLISDELIKII